MQNRCPKSTQQGGHSNPHIRDCLREDSGQGEGTEVSYLGQGAKRCQGYKLPTLWSSELLREAEQETNKKGGIQLSTATE